MHFVSMDDGIVGRLGHGDHQLVHLDFIQVHIPVDPSQECFNPSDLFG
jgi:hypothetical protein